jgi:hypothetical protein
MRVGGINFVIQFGRKYTQRRATLCSTKNAQRNAVLTEKLFFRKIRFARRENVGASVFTERIP